MAEAQNRTDELEQRTAECRQTQEESLENVRDPSEVEILLEEAFKCSPMGMAIFDNDMRYVRINETLAKFNGVPAREHIGKTIRDIIPNLADVIEPIMRRVLDTGEPVINASLSGSIPPEFGALRHWSHHWSPLKDKDGQVIGVSAIIEEITDRKRAEEALRESEEKYRSLFESSIDGILLTSPDGRIYSANPAACRILQMTEEEVIQAGRDGIVDLSDTRPQPALEERRQKHRARVELLFKRKDGTTFPTDVSSSVITDKEEHARSAVVFRDISERKEAEEKVRRLNAELEQKVDERTRTLVQTVDRLEKQREVLQTVFDNIPVMLAFYDSTEKIGLLNKELERVLGWSRQEMRSMDLMTAIYPDPSYRREVWEYMMEAKPGWKDLEMTTRSGDRVYASWTNVRLSDGSQIGIGFDVSERRKMEQDVRRLVKAIEQAGEGILILSPEWIIEYVNPIYEVLTGYSQNELLGRKITDHSLYARESDSWEIIDYVTKHGTAWTGSQKRTRKTGEPMDVNLTVSPVQDQEGKVTNYVAVVRDITREVRMQGRLLQNQKLEAIGTLASGIAHDLKNIFTPIVINTEIALMDVEQDHPAHEILEEIMQAAKMGTDVVNQIVTFSRRNLQEKRPVAIESVLKETLDFLRTALPSTIDIRTQLSAPGTYVLADPIQIKQVMINLGSNAGYAMRETGGELDVKLIRQDLSREEAARISPELTAGSYVRITVKDTGVGMDEQTVQRIFEPFFTTKEHGEGSGMGMSVVHGIVRDHKGAISVCSRPGKGSTFSVLLPMFRGDSEKKESTSVSH